MTTTHQIPYAPLDTVLGKLDEIKQQARKEDNLLLYNLTKVLQQIACVAYTARDNSEHTDFPAMHQVATQPAATNATQAPPANPTAALQGQGVPVTPPSPPPPPMPPPTSNPLGTNYGLNNDHNMVVVLHIRLEKPIDIYNLAARQELKDKIANRANVMQNVAFVEVL